MRIPDAKVGTGASFCILSRGIGEALDLPIEAGIRQTVGLANGQLFTVYGHEVTIESQGLQLDLLAYFAEDPALRRNVLGRQGWLAVVRLGLVDYDGELYLSHYNDSL